MTLTLLVFLCQNAFTSAFFLIFVKSIPRNSYFFYSYNSDSPHNIRKATAQEKMERLKTLINRKESRL